jgi:hypothetical protein
LRNVDGPPMDVENGLDVIAQPEGNMPIKQSQIFDGA